MKKIVVIGTGRMGGAFATAFAKRTSHAVSIRGSHDGSSLAAALSRQTRFAATGDPNGQAPPLPWFIYGQNADNEGRDHVFFATDAQGGAKREPFLQFETPLAEGAGFHFDVCENFWDEVAGDINNGHAVGSDLADGPMPENAGNEKFLTNGDLDKDDQQGGLPHQ